MKNIFENAKFSSKYVTRNGDIALYLCDCILVIAGTVTPISYNHRGIAIGKDRGYDIICKYNLLYKIKKVTLTAINVVFNIIKTY